MNSSRGNATIACGSDCDEVMHSCTIGFNQLNSQEFIQVGCVPPALYRTGDVFLTETPRSDTPIGQGLPPPFYRDRCKNITFQQHRTKAASL